MVADADAEPYDKVEVGNASLSPTSRNNIDRGKSLVGEEREPKFYGLGPKLCAKSVAEQAVWPPEIITFDSRLHPMPLHTRLTRRHRWSCDAQLGLKLHL